MSSRPPIIINSLDAERLQRLIDDATDQDWIVAEALEAELSRGEVLDPELMPDDVVSMNSQVQFTDLRRGRQLTRTLVYPHALATTDDSISIFAPIGSALLGLRVGDIIDWKLPDGTPSRVRIDAILWQPEQNKQFHR